MKKWMILAGVAVACGLGAQAASFSNLNFEAYSGAGSEEYLPGWSNNHNVCLDCFPLEGAWIGLLTTNNENNAPLEGNAALFLGTGNLLSYGVDEIWVSQTADVPANATQIRFLTTLQGVGATLGGFSLVTNAPAENPPGVYRYTADISSLAGQTATLKIGIEWSSWGRHQLDQIEFLDVAGRVIGTSPTPICLEDFHAGTLNTSLWEVVSIGEWSVLMLWDGNLKVHTQFPPASSETELRLRSSLRGDWDVRMNYALVVTAGGKGTGVVGMALGAFFGEDATATARIGRMANANSSDPHCMVDWGQGPTNPVATTSVTGVFRLVRTGWEVAGYIWDTGSNDWQMVGMADGYTDETARVGLETWNTGAYGGKGYDAYFENLTLADGRMSLAGLAVKTFGLDGAGAPTVAWESAGMPTNTRVVVTRATSLVDSVWTPVSGAIGDAGAETNWTGSGGVEGPAYYRLQVVPGN